MRDTSSRRQRISAMLNEQGSVQVLPLSDMFGVSTQTIRKDLFYLEERGIATRSYGGAILSSAISIMAEAAVEIKRSIHTTEKERIGRRAAAMVMPGDSIVLDSGTTTALIARHLPDSEDITVVTNDFGVLSELVAKSRIKIVMLGGGLRRKNMAFYGAQTEVAMSGLFVDKLFLGVDGYDMEKGITTHYESEALLNRMMANMARQVIAVTDSSKFGRMCLHKIIGINELDSLITDKAADQSIVHGTQALDVDVILA